MRSRKAKSEVVELQPLEPAVREVATIIRRYRLSYEQLSYVTKMARRRTELRNPRPSKKLPRNLTDQQLASFFHAIERGGNAEHILLFRLAYFTGLRVAELCGLLRDDVDVQGLSIRVNQGKAKPEELNGDMFPLRKWKNSSSWAFPASRLTRTSHPSRSRNVFDRTAQSSDVRRPRSNPGLASSTYEQPPHPDSQAPSQPVC